MDISSKYAFQTPVINNLINILDTYNKALLQAPTGSGKTRISLLTVVKFAEARKLKKIVWVAHQTHLAHQGHEDLEQLFPGDVTPEIHESDSIIVFSVKGIELHFMPWHSLRERKDIGSFDMLVLDEVHQGSSGKSTHSTFKKITVKGNIKYHLYVSATPWKLDPKLFPGFMKDGKINQDQIQVISTKQLRELGVLCDVEIVSVQTSETLILKKINDNMISKISGTNEHLAQKVLSEKVDLRDEKSINALNKSVLITLSGHVFKTEIERHKWSIPKTIVFASSVDIKNDNTSTTSIVKHLSELLKTKGFKGNLVRTANASLGAKNGIKLSAKVLDAFKQGKFPVLVVCGMAREGFNCPPVSVLIDFSPSFKNLKLQVQKIGRGMRTFDGKSLCRYYYPDILTHYLHFGGVRKEISDERGKLLGLFRGEDSPEVFAQKKNILHNMINIKDANGELPEGTVDVVEPKLEEHEYIGLDNNSNNFLPKSPEVKAKIITVTLGYIISKAYCKDNNYTVKTVNVFGDDAKAVPGSHNSDENKILLIEMAKRGDERPKWKTKLGSALQNYTLKWSGSYDEEFDKLIRKLAPHWFFSSSDENKRLLIEMAKRGDERPKWKTKLGKVLRNYTHKSSESYDEEFDKLIRKLAPHWFFSSSDENKILLIEMAKRGDERPNFKTKLGKALRNYTAKSSYSYDEEFDKLIRTIGPRWFISGSSDENKILLIEMAKRGDERPNSKTKLGKVLTNYTIKLSKSYDEEFDKLIRKLAPHWFKHKEKGPGITTRPSKD